ncbi:MAG: hypothetical protein HC820_05500 [Hydrococcus sp. RM1_1_31]|nr:hypothetical protein [Hydrococcus sp. RM1_1_31]
MLEHQISLSEEVYNALLAVAQRSGMTPADWIASKLPEKESDRPLPELLSGLVGAIDSQQAPRHQYEKTAFGEMIAAKLAKQGIRRP